MTLQSSGAISFDDIQDEFGGSNPISMTEYYGKSTLPSSGEISLSDFYGTANAISTTYKGTSSSFTVSGSGIVVCAGMTVGNFSNPPNLTSVTVDGSSTSFTTIDYRGGDWLYGTNTPHVPAVCGYFTVSGAGSHTITVAGDTTMYSFFLANASTLVGGVQFTQSSQTISLDVGQSCVSVASSQKFTVAPTQGSPMTQVYGTNDWTLAYKDGGDAGNDGYLTVHGGGGGYVIFGV